jgi:NAD(P)H-hydrate epimerase
VIPTVSVEQMRELDRLMIEELHVELLQLMETRGAPWPSRHASWSAVMCTARRSSYSAGRGGNGGGGLAAGRQLAIRGLRYAGGSRAATWRKPGQSRTRMRR